MIVTEVHINLMGGDGGPLRAFASVVFDDCFVVRDLKILCIGGRTVVAMPVRKATDRCPHCRGKNHLRARYCNCCGIELVAGRERGATLYHDTSHPINREFRAEVERAVLSEYHAALPLPSVDMRYTAAVSDIWVAAQSDRDSYDIDLDEYERKGLHCEQ